MISLQELVDEYGCGEVLPCATDQALRARNWGPAITPATSRAKPALQFRTRFMFETLAPATGPQRPAVPFMSRSPSARRRASPRLSPRPRPTPRPAARGRAFTPRYRGWCWPLPVFAFPFCFSWLPPKRGGDVCIKAPQSGAQPSRCWQGGDQLWRNYGNAVGRSTIGYSRPTRYGNTHAPTHCHR